MQMGRVYLMRDDLDRAHDEFLPVVEKMIARKEADKAAGAAAADRPEEPVPREEPGQAGRDLPPVPEGRRRSATAYSQLTEAYINAGQFAEAAEALEVLVAREPQNLQHRTKLEFVRGKLGGERVPAAARAPPPAPRRTTTSSTSRRRSKRPPRLRAARPRPRRARARAAARARVQRPAPRPPIEVSGPLSEEEKEFIDEHLAEGKVFRKYGLVDKAADQFEAVVARFPDNVDARQELREVYREKGQGAKAAAQCLALAEIFRLKGDEAAAAEQEAEAGTPGSVGGTARRRARPRGTRRRAAAPPGPRSRGRGGDPSRGRRRRGRPGAGHRRGRPPARAGGRSKAAAKPAAAEPDIDLGIDLDGEEELSAQFIDDEEPPPAPPARRAPAAAPPPVAEEEFVLEEDTAGPLADAGFEEDLDFEAAAPQTVTPLAARPSQADEPETDAPPELARVLDEVDSYISLGFVDDAKEALREARQRFADHPALAAKLSELGIDLAADDTAEHEAGLAREAERDPLDDLDLGPAGEADSGSVDDLVRGRAEPDGRRHDLRRPGPRLPRLRGRAAGERRASTSATS